MQDPSFGVAPPLQGHVHLISGQRFAQVPSFAIEQAFRYLVEAPGIVKGNAPMSWQYVSGPPDGTVWLEWISPRSGNHFASDGYLWGDPEQTYRQEIGGYTMEMLVHTVGYKPGFDATASHARTRYHLISKNPNVNAGPPDPSLWIVHYYQTDPSRMLPAQQMPSTPSMHKIIHERRLLESQGALERKEFMLHDREHWPQIHVPGQSHMSMQHPAYGANPATQQQQQQQQMAQQQRYPQYPAYPQPGGPPAKRARHTGPTAMPGSSDGGHDPTLEEEENTASGDFFDHLSPRDISMARYMQHHRWMEEVYSSPYASSQIVPPDLGLGLMGELKGLTDGIVDPPSLEDIGKQTTKPENPKETQPFTNLKKEQLDEFYNRAAKHMEEGQAEIERMKKEHAEKMADMRKTNKLTLAEKRLRYATWAGHENAVPAHRLYAPVENGHAKGTMGKENVEDVVKEVEGLLGVKISAHEEATLIEKGGLERDEQRRPSRDAGKPDGAMVEDKQSASPQDASAAGLSNGTAQASATPQPAVAAAGAQAQPLPTAASSDAAQQQHAQSQAGEQPQPMAQEQQADTSMFNAADSLPTADAMQDINMDLDTSAVTFDTPPQPTPTADTPSALQSSTQNPTPQPPLQQPQQQQAAPSPQQDLNPATTTPADPPANPSTAAPTPATGMFDDNTFADLAGMDDGPAGGDGLIDFDAGMGMGMDDSAFGDALHGMEAGEGEGTQGTPAGGGEQSAQSGAREQAQ